MPRRRRGRRGSSPCHPGSAAGTSAGSALRGRARRRRRGFSRSSDLPEACFDLVAQRRKIDRLGQQGLGAALERLALRLVVAVGGARRRAFAAAGSSGVRKAKAKKKGGIGARPLARRYSLEVISGGSSKVQREFAGGFSGVRDEERLPGGRVKENGRPEPRGICRMNKLDIVREHLITVMQLIAVEASPVSTHVIVMATEEMVRDLAKHRGALLEWDYKNLVKEEHQKIFGKAFRKAYNFYKHANEDPDASFAGPDVDDLRMINEVLTLQNMHGYAKLIGRWSDEMVTFPSWLMLSRPTFFRAELFAMMPVSRGER